MKLGVLFSGGKDSVYACHMALLREDVSCLITLRSSNKESYMFHTPNIDLTGMQAEAAGIPLLRYETAGEKEKELNDLKAAVSLAKENYGIEGVVTGAVMSVYQASRVQKICDELDLFCFNPLWYVNQDKYMNSLIEDGFEVIIAGVYSCPFDEKWPGRVIDIKTLSELKKIRERYHITLTGEGGEYESFVCDAPFFKKKIVIDESSCSYRNYNGTLSITSAHLEDK
jgi:ABC transporter with metal-binding/Fe-S-binding domain ATP-binding protein